MKRVKELKEIVLPFQFSPKQYIAGQVNGVAYFFYPGKTHTMKFSEYEAILHSSYAKELKN